MATNDFLPFCPDDIGTNLESQADYLIDSDRTQGNQPGVASSKLNNKALRQSSYVSGLLAQLVSNITGADTLDNATPTQFLAQLEATFSVFAPASTGYSGPASGNHNLTLLFFIATGSATTGATYTNNAVTFTVVATVAAGTIIRMTGASSPDPSGTLTKTSGTGDATLTFYAYRAPQYLRVRLVGGGSGGSGTSAANGQVTSFGTSLLSADGGIAAASGGTVKPGPGSSASIVAPAYGSVSGGVIGANGFSTGGGALVGSSGASSPFGAGGVGQVSGGTAATNGGAGAGGGGLAAGISVGASGNSGAYLDAIIPTPSLQYAYVVGNGGVGGTSGSGTSGDGGAGFILVEEYYQ